jgi:transcriptional regulator
MINRGRGAIGIKHGRHKLTDIQVLEILKLRASGEKIINLSRKFHVSNGTVSLIANKRIWRHIEEAVNDNNNI